MKALALFVFLASPFVQANQCIEIFKDKTLTYSQNYWLNIAQNTDYNVKHLIAPNGKNVVLMGETHLKNIIASAVGKRVLLEFPHAAHELASHEKTWGGEFFAIYLESVFNYIQTTTSRSKQSTINDAHTTRSEIISSLQNLEDVLAKTPYVDIKKIKEKPYSEKDYTNYKNFFLENNHKPDLKENLYSIIVPTEYLAKVLLIPSAVAAYSFPNSFFADLVLPTVVTIVGVRAIHKYLGGKLKNKYSNHSWYNNVFFDDLGVIDARNKTKSKNINKILNENPEVETLLVIVGKLHVEGILSNLKKNGFTQKENNKPN